MVVIPDVWTWDHWIMLALQQPMVPGKTSQNHHLWIEDSQSLVEDSPPWMSQVKLGSKVIGSGAYFTPRYTIYKYRF